MIKGNLGWFASLCTYLNSVLLLDVFPYCDKISFKFQWLWKNIIRKNFYALLQALSRVLVSIFILVMHFLSVFYGAIYCIIRRFSHVTKSPILKNLKLRRKAGRNFGGNLLKNHFRHLTFYSNPPNWLAKSCCHMSSFWKT